MNIRLFSKASIDMINEIDIFVAKISVEISNKNQVNEVSNQKLYIFNIRFFDVIVFI